MRSSPTSSATTSPGCCRDLEAHAAGTGERPAIRDDVTMRRDDEPGSGPLASPPAVAREGEGTQAREHQGRGFGDRGTASGAGPRR